MSSGLLVGGAGARVVGAGALGGVETRGAVGAGRDRGPGLRAEHLDLAETGQRGRPRRHRSAFDGQRGVDPPGDHGGHDGPLQADPRGVHGLTRRGPKGQLGHPEAGEPPRDEQAVAQLLGEERRHVQRATGQGLRPLRRCVPAPEHGVDERGRAGLQARAQGQVSGQRRVGPVGEGRAEHPPRCLPGTTRLQALGDRRSLPGDQRRVPIGDGHGRQGGCAPREPCQAGRQIRGGGQVTCALRLPDERGAIQARRAGARGGRDTGRSRCPGVRRGRRLALHRHASVHRSQAQQRRQRDPERILRAALGPAEGGPRHGALSPR
jgi:hypothetical protein